MKHAQRGFTIVELLIVIVVIAILAAITIISYNNITARAKNTQLLSAIDAYEKGVRLFASEKSAPPDSINPAKNPNVAPTHNNSNLNAIVDTMQACLPGDYPATADFAAGECSVTKTTVQWDSGGTSTAVGKVSVNTSIGADLAPSYISSLPKVPSTDVVRYGYSVHLDNMYWEGGRSGPAQSTFEMVTRGAQIAIAGPNMIQVVYLISSDQVCGRGTRQTVSLADFQQALQQSFGPAVQVTAGMSNIITTCSTIINF